MQLFYASEIKLEGNNLDKTDSGHCVKVLRKSAGNTIHIVDGKGTLYEAEIMNGNPNKCSYKIVGKTEAYQKSEKYLHLAIAPTKNINRFEWFMEKATEIGINEITPIVTYHSERKKINEERLNKILISAMKQSLKAYLPKLNPLVKWKQFLKDQAERNYDFKGIACMTEKSRHFTETNKGQNALVLIGPEGGFSEQEIAEATASDCISVTLGASRLRTETAGIVACTLFH